MLDECEEWPKSRNKNRGGYGQINWRGKIMSAHRWAWEQANGPIPAGMWVLHRCDNPPCVKLSHLFLGTQTDNMRDASTKGRCHGRYSKPTPGIKLSIEQVDAIRSSNLSNVETAKLFGVRPETISRIRHRHTRWLQ